MRFPAILFCLVILGARVSCKIDADGCGQRPLAPTARVAARIVGGEESAPYSWPFMCSIEDSTWNYHICAGSLIKNRNGDYFVMTAAHCVSHDSSNVGRFKVWCSIHNVDIGDPRAQTMQLQEIIIHPRFDVDYNDDIALFRLSAAPNETDSLQPVCLPTVAHEAFEMATVLGWGHTSEGGTRSPVLREGSKPIVSDSECQNAYGSAFRPANMLCAGYLGTGGVDACTQDSGGPLVVQRNGSYEVAGIVSWGYGCGHPEYPGVYADVHDLTSWVNTVINF